MNRSVSVVLVVLAALVVAATTPVGVVSASGSAGQPTAVQGAPASATSDDVDSGDFDTTTFEITVHENGSATWTFRYERRLDDDTATRTNFQEFADTFESEETGMYERFTDQAQAMVEGHDAVDREMEATGFNRSAKIDGQLNPIGVVEMSFRWDGFAETDDGRVVVGDVFEDIYITDRQSIVVVPDGDLEFHRAEPEPEYPGTSLRDADYVQWRGEREFIDGHPRVVLERPDEGLSGSAPLTENTGFGDRSTPWSVALATLVVAVGVGVAVWYRRQTGIDADEAPDSGPPSTGPDRPASDEGADDSAPGPVPEDGLLTDEDRVVSLIRENGGRMKQVNIVEETGWSKSKVSMLLSDMEEEGTISKLRVGRENIISLEGFEPEATKSPFEE